MYVISGKHYNKGIIGNDSSLLDGYYELGWECGLSNVYIKDLLSKNKIKRSDTIVTREGREFFYTSLFDNVITWQDFCKLNVDPSETINVLDKKHEQIDYYGVDVDLVCNFDLDKDVEQKYSINDKFMIYCIRLRDHCPFRNSDIEVAKNSIIKFINNGYKVFVVGQGSQILENILPVKYLELRDYASLLSSKYCSFVISPLSGIVHVANFTARKGLRTLIFDHAGERSVDNHPMLMGNCINYKNLDIKFIRGVETEEQIQNHLGDFLK